MLNYEYPPLGGGAANATRHLLDAWARHDEIEIVLICSSPDVASIESPHAKVRIERLDIGKRSGLHYQTQVELLRYAWRAWRRSRQLLREERFDGCLAFFGIPCGFIASRLGLPYIVSLRGSDVPFYNPRFALLDRLLFQRLSRRVWRRAACVVANSVGLHLLANKTAADQMIEVIPNGVDTERFHPPLSPAEGFEILCVARLIPRKGIADLIRAVAQLPPAARLTVIGDGTERDNLKLLAEGLGIAERVRLLGALTHDALPPHYRAAHVFALPSKNEGMSNTVLEAMASGLPLVLTDTGGTAELLEPGVNGVMVPMSDPAALARALMRYLEEPELARAHGAVSRRKSEAMGWKASAEAYLKLFEQHFAGSRRDA